MPEDESSSFEQDQTIAYQLYPDAMIEMDAFVAALESDFDRVSELLLKRRHLFRCQSHDELILMPQWPRSGLVMTLRYHPDRRAIERVQLRFYSLKPLAELMYEHPKLRAPVEAANLTKEQDDADQRLGRRDGRSQIDFAAPTPQPRWITWQDQCCE